MNISLKLPLLLASAGLLAAAAFAQAADPQAAEYRAGKSFIPTRIHSAEEDGTILRAFEGLRVADVTDGMDYVGLHNVGLMDPAIHPLWKDAQTFAHRFVGIAVTARYVPTQRPAAGGARTYEDFRAWEGRWYNELSPEPFQALIRPGTAIVIDDAPDADVGSIGSFNILAWKVAVAEFAHRIGEADRAARRDLYRRAGLPEDPSVRE